MRSSMASSPLPGLLKGLTVYKKQLHPPTHSRPSMYDPETQKRYGLYLSWI